MGDGTVPCDEMGPPCKSTVEVHAAFPPNMDLKPPVSLVAALPLYTSMEMEPVDVGASTNNVVVPTPPTAPMAFMLTTPFEFAGRGGRFG